MTDNTIEEAVKEITDKLVEHHVTEESVKVEALLDSLLGKDPYISTEDFAKVLGARVEAHLKTTTHFLLLIRAITGNTSYHNVCVEFFKEILGTTLTTENVNTARNSFAELISPQGAIRNENPSIH